MTSKRNHEGYLLIDHRASPGVPDAIVAQTAMPVGSGRGMFETATITCSHCQQIVVVNPMRTRARGYCPKCDHYVCDVCEGVRVQTGVCKTFKEVMDEVCEAAEKSAV